MSEQMDGVAAIRGGDPATMEAVIRECLPGLMRTAIAAGLPRDRAEDAVQASLLVFVQRASEYDGRARVSTWLHGILVRKIWEERRTARRERAQEDIDEVVESRFDADGTGSARPADRKRRWSGGRPGVGLVSRSAGGPAARRVHATRGRGVHDR